VGCGAIVTWLLAAGAAAVVRMSVAGASPHPRSAPSHHTSSAHPHSRGVLRPCRVGVPQALSWEVTGVCGQIQFLERYQPQALSLRAYHGASPQRQCNARAGGAHHCWVGRGCGSQRVGHPIGRHAHDGARLRVCVCAAARACMCVCARMRVRVSAAAPANHAPPDCIGPLQVPYAIGGSGSAYVYGFCDKHWRPDMPEAEAKSFVVRLGRGRHCLGVCMHGSVCECLEHWAWAGQGHLLSCACRASVPSWSISLWGALGVASLGQRTEPAASSSLSPACTWCALYAWTCAWQPATAHPSCTCAPVRCTHAHTPASGLAPSSRCARWRMRWRATRRQAAASAR